MSVTTNDSLYQDYTHPDDHITHSTATSGFKPFTLIYLSYWTIFSPLLFIAKHWSRLTLTTV